MPRDLLRLTSTYFDLLRLTPTYSAPPQALSTLRFGGRARRVRNFARMNATVDVADVREVIQVEKVAEDLQEGAEIWPR